MKQFYILILILLASSGYSQCNDDTFDIPQYTTLGYLNIMCFHDNPAAYDLDLNSTGEAVRSPLLSLTTTGTGAATYSTSTRVLNIPTPPSTTKYYNGSGIINQPIKKWVGVVTPSVSSGESISISSAGFGTILSVNLTGMQNLATVKAPIAVAKTVSTSSVVMNLYQSKNTAVLLGGNVEGLQFHDAPSSTSVYVEVTGY